jgi:hypothetical protein
VFKLKAIIVSAIAVIAAVGAVPHIAVALAVRTGMHTVRRPGDQVGLDESDPTLAKILKALG